MIKKKANPDKTEGHLPGVLQSGSPVRSYLRLVVLKPVGFVHHQAGPVYGAQDGRVDGDQLVRGQQDMELNRGVFLFGGNDKEDVQFPVCSETDSELQREGAASHRDTLTSRLFQHTQTLL